MLEPTYFLAHGVVIFAAFDCSMLCLAGKFVLFQTSPGWREKLGAGEDSSADLVRVQVLVYLEYALYLREKIIGT